MNKRNHNSSSNKSKKTKLDNINVTKNIVVRNDDDPHVFTNIDCRYVKIGNFIYKTKPFDKSWNKFNETSQSDTVCVTLTQYNDISNYVFQKKVLVSSFYNSVPTIDTLTISITNESNFKIVAKCKEITKYILDLLIDHIVTINQNFVTYFQDTTLNITINDADNMPIGKITDETCIEFKSFDSNIVICKNHVDIDTDLVNVYVTKCINLNTHLNKIKFPLIIDKTIMNKYVRDAFKESFTDNETVMFTVDNIEYSFNIKVNDSNKQSKFKNTYLLEDNNKEINIQSKIDNVIITEDTKAVEKICFLVDKTSGQKYDVNDYILLVDDLLNYVKKNISNLTTKQIFNYQYGKKDYSLKINYINPSSNSEILYKIDSETSKITFEANPKSKIILVENSNPYEIEKITFKLKKIPVGGLFALFGGMDNKQQFFEPKKLQKMIRNLFPKKTTLKHQMKLSYSGNDCIVCVKNIIFSGQDMITTNKKKYMSYGLITDDTEFKFEISPKNKSFTINDNFKNKLLENPIEELEKYVGGISDELKTVVRTICLARGKLRDEFSVRGLKAAKGIIFHGLPGTGKTSLARNLGKILGCEGDRFKLMSGPEVFNKWVGESEANVRAIFKPAKDAWKKHGENAPVYMVVIDEIDAMIPARSGSSGNPVRDSVVNQFLAEMDGLEQFNNLICIGITNRLELLDPAAIRAGRFGVHIKIGIPNKEGRAKIFDIHTKKLKELGRLENINFGKLVDQTENFTGADIENTVELASMYSLERLNKLDDIDKEKIDQHGKITYDDFIRAIKEVSAIGKKQDKNDKIPNMYI